MLCDSEWRVLRALRRGFVTGDGSGLCEHVLVREELISPAELRVESQRVRTGCWLPPDLPQNAPDEDDAGLASSPDVQPTCMFGHHSWKSLFSMGI